MPIYMYQADEAAQSCEFCVEGFEFMPRTSEVTLERCPKCRAAVHRVMSAVNVGSSEAEKLKDHNVAKAGFSIYRKSDEGTYERTSGSHGPKVLKT